MTKYIVSEPIRKRSTSSCKVSKNFIIAILSLSNNFSLSSDSVFDVTRGFNATIFAYGQTGSGKTFTMFG